jgi:hypothetical protein
MSVKPAAKTVTIVAAEKMNIPICAHCCPVDGGYDFSIALQDKGF